MYLGLTITKDPKLLYKLNFAEFLSELKGNREKESLAFIYDWTHKLNKSGLSS